MKICIDPGHNYSGYNTGAVGNGIREQDITFLVAEKLRVLLESAGVEVIFTRPSMTTNLGTNNATSLRERYTIANRSGAELFISLHCNAGGGTGVETLVYSKGTKAALLGDEICRQISNSLALSNRGVRERPELAVLRGTKMASVLVEMAFIDRATDAEKLKHRQKDFARAIFEAVTKIYGFNKEEDMAQTKNLTDLKGHFSAAAVEKLLAYGVVNGYADKTFRPEQPITRGEAAVMLANALTVLGK